MVINLSIEVHTFSVLKRKSLKLVDQFIYFGTYISSKDKC